MLYLSFFSKILNRRILFKKNNYPFIGLFLIFIILLQSLSAIFIPFGISPVGNSVESAQASGENWYETGGTWNYRKQIIVNHNKVEEDLTDFPVLISFADAQLKSVSNGGNVENSSGYDLLFTSSDGSTKLSYEIEKYDSATGEIVAWVKAPSLSASADTVIYLYYGNDDISESLQDVVGDTWSDGYKVVSHFSDFDGSYMLDSTYINDLYVIYLDTSPGKINEAQSFSADSYADGGNHSNISEITFEAWVKPTLSDWTKKKQIIISGESELAPIRIDYAEGMQSDFKDLRFLDRNGSLLEYNIISYTASTFANIILDLALVPDSQVVYMYYGNPLALDSTSYSYFKIPELTGWAHRYELATVHFHNKFWVMGGLGEHSLYSDVWSSVDGINWTQETTAPWVAREGFQSVVFDDKIWVMGGNDEVGNELNDVWSSVDGINWTQETTHAPWVAREGFQSVVFDDKIWVMGGGKYGSWDTLNDVWSSVDGINWIQETANASWHTRQEFKSVVFDDKIWVMGGYYGVWNEINDVWSSTDGINWIQETANASWSAREGFQSVVFDDKIWVMGGNDAGSDPLNDVWSSVDGINWIQETANASWSAREEFQSVVFDDKIWVMGGRDFDWSFLNDIWSSADGISWFHDSAPFFAYSFGDAQDFSGALGVILDAVDNYNLSVNGDNIPVDEWTHLALTNNGTVQRYYINGELISSQNKAIVTTNLELCIGTSCWYSFPFLGAIDEARVSSNARSAGWIKTQYNNQSGTSTFYALSRQEAYGVNLPSNFSFDSYSNKIQLFWQANGNDETTEYYISNLTQSANSPWQTTLNYEFTNLDCNTTYQIQIKARKNGLETVYDNYSVPTANCGFVLIPPSPSTNNPSKPVSEESQEEDAVTNEVDNEGGKGDVSPEEFGNISNEEKPPSSASTINPTPPLFERNISFGNRGEDVKQLQGFLKQLNFFPSNINANGNFGPATLQAVKNFQKAHGINPTGFVGPITLKALNYQNIVSNPNYQFNQDLKYNDRNQDVAQLQTHLRERAFFPLSVSSTGWFGPITQRAVNLFKKIYDLVPNRIVDGPMRDLLNVE
jgi:peptidoglycan hydrolase-like protein with peptidoglycan-binding domain